MERGPNYALHEDDAYMTAQDSYVAQQSPLMQRNGRTTSGYQPPVPPGAKALDVAIQTKRIMDRDPVFQRSRGRWNIRREKVDNYWKLYLQDPFHTFINMRLSKVMSGLIGVYLIVLIIFGALYTTVPREMCKTAIFTYFDGFSFSVSVMFTIGFGTNGGDVFFGDCVWMQVIITVQSLIAIILDALSIGVLFGRFARAQARANTIVLSSTAVVRRIRGELYFMFQACEMRKHQLVEAHVRMYAIRHDYEFGQHYYFQSYPMRIQHPNDELNGMMLLALPSVVVHRLDAWSPLMRPKSASSCGYHHDPVHSYMFPEVMGRQADIDYGDRDGKVALDTTRPSVCNRCRCPIGEPTPPVTEQSHEAIIEDIKNYWRESQLEVVVLVEGIDAVTSATIQVRHSYTADEIAFDQRFENCVDVDPETGGAVIDFKRFHETHPADPECVKVAGAFY
ncbi:hypothetical protein Poli38472_003513 [Pythium oligandrum]|uniref:Uncharacterized protein n=1 Tax=Pythium oligandrum TaxID=41045 RepID=A0A8K1C704_PYTOL|nr:hypothetical protein Poli38472_003513 [Pythium oligandrum]|eukprot:TMW57588.1 hypothetical protein Poli38472_003513 [Pythium oligandrum]